VAETETTGKRSCGVYGNEQGDTQRQRLEVMKVTVVVYDVRTGDQVTRKTFLPPARCPETARKGKKTTVILPSERDIASWLKAQ
jgi:hypothetical protein